MSIAQLLLLAWAVSAAGMALAYVGAKRSGKIGYVDVAWAALMGIAALLVAALADGAPLARAMVALFGAGWALRLCLYLWRRVAHEPEDGRYLALRERWQDSDAAFFAFFQGQALVVALFAVPFAAVATLSAGPSIALVLAASVLWLFSVGGETLADRQLAQFRADPANRGRTCRVGLWAWSRHPNYFFEWLHWFTYPLLALGSPYWWLALAGPVLMGLFLYRVSGIPWTEAQSLRSRGDDYRRYQQEVSPFFPMPPKRG